MISAPGAATNTIRRVGAWTAVRGGLPLFRSCIIAFVGGRELIRGCVECFLIIVGAEVVVLAFKHGLGRGRRIDVHSAHRTEWMFSGWIQVRWRKPDWNPDSSSLVPGIPCCRRSSGRFRDRNSVRPLGARDQCRRKSPPAVARLPSSTNLAPRLRWISGNCLAKERRHRDMWSRLCPTRVRFWPEQMHPLQTDIVTSVFLVDSRIHFSIASLGLLWAGITMTFGAGARWQKCNRV